MPIIEVQHLSKSFADNGHHATKALDDISFSVEKGEVVGIIGPSGSGKTTLLRTLNLLDRPTSGNIVVDGQTVTTPGYPVDLLRQHMGFVFQNFNLFPHLTLLGNIMLPLTKVKHMPREEAQGQAMQMLAKVSLAEKADALPSTLSGGQQQRAAIARTLALHPSIILFDEPTSALDPTTVSEVTGVIRLLAKEGLTMLIVTHKMKVAKDLTTRILFLNQGRLIQDSTSSELFSNPTNPVVRAFVHRIRSLVFDIASRQFDFYDMMSQIRQFCIRHAIADKMDNITHIVEEMLLLVADRDNAVHIEINHSELNGNTSVAFTHVGADVSPLDHPAADELAVMIIRGMSKEVKTDHVAEGIRLIFEL